MHKKICIVTGSRSEYGLLHWLMKEVKSEPTMTLQLIATGMHLSHEFGLTYKKIMEDGFIIDEKIEMLLSSDTAVGITKSIGLGVIGFADAYARLKPDMVILLGDRFETLAAAQAAFIAKIPIAHIHGGELSLGAYDDGIRHSVTKMSHLHFVATPSYRDRVIQLGEDPENVYHVGAMVIDSISQLSLLKRAELEKKLDLTFRKLIFAVTFHPETLGKGSPREEFGELLKALSYFQDTTFIFTKGNADSDGRVINDMIDDFCKDNPHSSKAFLQLGHHHYLSLLSIADVCVGNSSSGIIEVPYFNIPTVNIGDRQKGRVRPISVLDCQANEASITACIQKALSKEFRQEIFNMQHPYGEGPVAKKIVSIIKKSDFTNLIRKNFCDLKQNG
ncbi:MAG: UDP-N-acetylglucosamine 2-epimerase (hydrolyzing) [Gammaproteobacteria bacterium]|jgi:UDP-N-acetylglucosamine 2-epimerase (non-hydrolysing)/GDP/UDP-N,N'-diacetylbacillosamine 2-epimerase (hydrolysing)|nr:UDP-N-acetylglucosamine 2-epimerase (hydrolyzing) [Gammaproteobacteria bacterium]